MDASSPDNPETAVTPMMAQYLEIKAKAEDALLFYRMGDFYELFFDDAVKAAAALDITLTKRGRHQGADIPMCGVPVHSHEGYLARLIKHGFNVAICEQTEDPAEAKKRGSKAVVRREIVRLITPGTLTEDSLLDASSNNYLAALAILRGGSEAALAFADVSTGDLEVKLVDANNIRMHLAALSPSELIVPDVENGLEDWSAAFVEFESVCPVVRRPYTSFDSAAGERRLKELFNVAALDAFGDFGKAELSAIGALLGYIALTQIGRMPALRSPRVSTNSSVMLIDQATRQSLEIVRTQAGVRDGSLLSAVDRTVTGPGARLLATRLASPLTDVDAINERLDAVDFFHADERLTDDIRNLLKGAPDMARSLSRLSLSRGGPRDLIAIRDGLACAREIAALLAKAARPVNLPTLVGKASRDLEAQEGGGFTGLMTMLTEALAADPPLFARDGGFIAKGFDPGLDSVRVLRDDARRVIAGLESAYKERTGVKSLKVKHNNVLGYFVETPPSAADGLMQPPHSDFFIHRQTLASAVRFTTTELAELDAKISRARDEALAREIELFERLVADVLQRSDAISLAAHAVAALDVAAGLASLAWVEAYVRPVIDASVSFCVEEGRHPVVEQVARKRGEARFTPNKCILADDAGTQVWLVTGPNMAGKSTFLRQNALIAILAQAGSFVPAAKAHVGVADRVFSRVGASDDLARGRSTFMVEMVETATILNQATDRSLVVLDEIGRGTSTFDGLSIAWAAVEYLHNKIGCRALFATHYHELTALEQQLPRLQNVSMQVREWKGDVVFLHEVGRGAADRSYGVAVARLAGLPPTVLSRAETVLRELESSGGRKNPLADLPLFAAAAPADAEPEEKEALSAFIRTLDPDAMTPRDALEALYQIKSLALESGDL